MFSRPPSLRCAPCLLGSVLAIVEPARGADPHPEWTLYTPYVGSTLTYLVDLDGAVVHTWPSSFLPGVSVYLADGGAILRTAHDGSAVFGGPGTGGRIERIAWDGAIEWTWVGSSAQYTPHHDIEPLPNGNVLVLAWERFTAAEAIAMGRDPASVGGDGVWAEAVLEVEPTGPTSGQVVWEWHAWDHLVQDFDPQLPGYGDPGDHPDRIDINYGYGGSQADWLHCNGLDYHAGLDQVVISSRNFNEIWIIAHAPGDPGGLLYRWGNPQAYGRGGPGDRRLFGQHDPEWIPEGIPGAGHLTIFNNGAGRGWSSIDELVPPLEPDGTYDLPPGGPYGPAAVAWTCDTIDGAPFFSGVMSGVQRLPNGNHLIGLAAPGVFVEVDEGCDEVWDFAAGIAFRATRLDARDPRLEGLLWVEGDANGDLDVDVEDLVLVILQWGTAGPEADVNGDGLVDVLDLVTVIGGWT